MPSYIYRVSRTHQTGRAGMEVAAPAGSDSNLDLRRLKVEDWNSPEVSYRDLQAQAKALDIPANQSADDLKKAIAEAT
jgi:hypothetical protein